MATITHYSSALNAPTERKCRVCREYRPITAAVEYRVPEYGPRAIYFCAAHACHAHDYSPVPVVGDHVALDMPDNERVLGHVLAITAGGLLTVAGEISKPGSGRDIHVHVNAAQVVIGTAAAAGMLERGAALDWSADAIVQNFGCTSTDELAYLTPGHLELFDGTVARATAKRAKLAAVRANATGDRSAGAVADLLGVEAPAATGGCHYCGLPLSRSGQCTECV